MFPSGKADCFHNRLFMGGFSELLLRQIACANTTAECMIKAGMNLTNGSPEDIKINVRMNLLIDFICRIAQIGALINLPTGIIPDTSPG